ncbi:MAG: division plane positioning ATPase MipZ [Caulobacteraceae bacterium]
MALVLLANTKGGSGKTTAALVLAGELLSHRARVVLLEGDPNRPLVTWAQARGVPVIETSRARSKTSGEVVAMLDNAAKGGGHRLVVVHDDHQEGVFEWIEGAASWAHFVIADPEGSPNEWLTDVASQADLVIIPFAPSALDAKQVSRTVQVLNRVAKRTGRAVNYRILLTRANAVMTRDEREIRQSLERNGLPLLATTLRERPAYRGLFKLDAMIDELSSEIVNGLDGARRNAAEYAREILDTLKAEAAPRTEAA